MRTCEEWSLQFDLLYNNIASDQAPGLTEYEKSVFLTNAQESVVVSLYRGTLGVAFESTEEMKTYLDQLIRQETLSSPKAKMVIGPKMDKDKSYLFSNPEGMLFRTWESCLMSTDCGTVSAEVVPITQDEYWRTVRNPFKGQGRSRVMRLTQSAGDGTDNGNTEIISDYPVLSYTVRYLSKPEPIILEDLPDGLSINGKSESMPCLLNEALHQTILSEAVKLAKAVWIQ